MKPENNSEETAELGCAAQVLFALKLEGLRARADTAMWACLVAFIAVNTGNETADYLIRLIAFIGLVVMWWAERKIGKIMQSINYQFNQPTNSKK